MRHLSARAYGPEPMKSKDWRDYITRGLLIVAGVVAAALFVMKGEGQALPPLALGGLLGAAAIRRVDSTEE